jgi:hypothetical protein
MPAAKNQNNLPITIVGIVGIVAIILFILIYYNPNANAAGQAIQQASRQQAAMKSTPTPPCISGDGRFLTLVVGGCVSTNGGYTVRLDDISAFDPIRAQFSVLDGQGNLLKVVYLGAGEHASISEANNLLIKANNLYPGAFGSLGVADVTIYSCATYGDARNPSLGIGCSIISNNGYVVQLTDISSFSPNQAQLKVFDMNGILVKIVFLAAGDSGFISEANNLFVKVFAVYPGSFDNPGKADVLVNSCLTNGDGRYSTLSVGCGAIAKNSYWVKLTDISSFEPIKAKFEIYNSQGVLVKVAFLGSGDTAFISEAQNLLLQVYHVYPGAFAQQGTLDVLINSCTGQIEGQYPLLKVNCGVMTSTNYLLMLKDISSFSPNRAMYEISDTGGNVVSTMILGEKETAGIPQANYLYLQTNKLFPGAYGQQAIADINIRTTCANLAGFGDYNLLKVGCVILPGGGYLVYVKDISAFQPYKAQFDVSKKVCTVKSGSPTGCTYVLIKSVFLSEGESATVTYNSGGMVSISDLRIQVDKVTPGAYAVPSTTDVQFIEVPNYALQLPAQS